MKIDRYQGWTHRNGTGAINDHQKNECVIRFNGVPREKAEFVVKCLFESIE